MEKKDLILNQRLDLWPSRISDCHDSTPFLYHVRYFVYLLGYSFQKGKAYCKASTMTITITVLTIVRTCFLTLACSSIIRPTSVVCSLSSQTSSCTSGAIHVRESLTKALPQPGIVKYYLGTPYLYPYLFQIPRVFTLY